MKEKNPCRWRHPSPFLSSCPSPARPRFDCSGPCRIPTGFRPKVPQSRDCEDRATLGHRPQINSNRNAVAAIPSPFHTRTTIATTALRLMIGRTMTQGRRRCANLGLEADAPLGHSNHGARSRADGHSPFPRLARPGSASATPARGESQRDSGPKSRSRGIARHELPWDTVRKSFPTATRLRPFRLRFTRARHWPQPRCG